MDANALLAEILKRSDFIFAGWNVLLLAGVGLIAAAAAVPALRADPRAGRALVAAFAFFALTHLLGMIHVTKQWASLTDGFKHLLRDDPLLRDRLAFAVLAPTVGWIVPFHLAFDAIVIVAVWRLTRPHTGGA